MAGEGTAKADEIGLNIKKFNWLRCLNTYVLFL